MSKPELINRISKDEFNEACLIYTIDEVRSIFNISYTGLRKLTKVYGGKPLQVCRRCGCRFTPTTVNMRGICPTCSGVEAPVKPVNKSNDCSVRYGCKINKQLENEARNKGISYADLQKQRTLAMVGKIDLGDVK